MARTKRVPKGKKESGMEVDSNGSDHEAPEAHSEVKMEVEEANVDRKPKISDSDSENESLKMEVGRNAKPEIDSSHNGINDNSNGSGFDDNNDDEVVKEIPVYLAQSAADYLHVFQYPLWESRSALKYNVPPLDARIKPSYNLVEIDLPIDTQDEMYNQNRGMELAVGLTEGETTMANPGRLLDIQTFISKVVPNQAQFMAGVYENGKYYELHLTPVKDSLQLRPSLKYLDKIDEKIKAATLPDEDEAEEEEEVAKPKAKAIQVQIRTAEAEEELRRKQNTLAYQQKKLKEEPWQRLDYYQELSDESYMARESLVATRYGPLECKTSKLDYLNQISAFGGELQPSST
ncbi:hypothetical protein EV182_002335 [Spiromyces aspiralis]|uniref:Uncharacterized protein n=1 Tax=Spiromyces aspiralis TaxID=68401 RepID=A0ACC1HKS5_9FUNG|nr:hypothetical protein EV182_002335 [Spiromyces aspiralis]